MESTPQPICCLFIIHGGIIIIIIPMKRTELCRRKRTERKGSRHQPARFSSKPLFRTEEDSVPLSWLSNKLSCDVIGHMMNHSPFWFSVIKC